MKGFLFDTNLPARLRFTPRLPLIHASALGTSPTDSELWAYALAYDLAIVSKDADFSQRIITASPPPRVVHIRVANMRSPVFHEFLARIWPRIEYLVAAHKLVNVYRHRIEAVH